MTPLERAEMDALLSMSNEPNPISFTDFKRQIYKGYQHAAHLEQLDAMLTQVARYSETNGQEGIGYLIITMPPRHGKTVTVSRLFPTWFIGRNPDKRVILASYGATLAHKNSRSARNIIMLDRYHPLFPISLAQGSKSADAWDIEGYEGGMDAMGVGGGVTGKGGHVIIIDDPVKSREEAESEVYREKTWDWFTDDVYSRREPGAAIIVVLTRWHMDDLAGRLLKNQPDKWTLLNYPAIAEDNDGLGRNPGDALWPERFPIDVLTDIQQTMGAYSWAALYQQRPVPAEGGIFKRSWFTPLRDNVPEITRAVRYWDLAMSEKTSADYTVGVKIGQAVDGHFYILDVARKRIDWGDLTSWLAEIMIADGSMVTQGIEEKGYMSRAIRDLNADPRLHDYRIFGYPVDKDKVTRALPFAAKCGADLVHVANAHWSQEYVDEVCSFPNGMHDDQVDASSGAWSMIGSMDYSSELYHAETYSISEGY